MGLQSVTVHLPDVVYQFFASRSLQTNHTVAEEVATMVTATVPQQGALAAELEQELNQLDFLSDVELKNAAELVAPLDETEEMQVLVEQQQRGVLMPDEKERMAFLSAHFNRIMLIRAKAVALLTERGHDMSLQFAEPIE